MAESDIDEVCDDIATFLGAATGIAVAQSYDEVTEAPGDFPLVQVYPDEGETDPSGNADRTTFRGAVRLTETVFNADFCCRPRGNLNQDVKAQVDVQKAVQAKLESIKTKPYFGNASIQGFSWSWRRATFEPVAGQQYAGVRFVIRVRQF